MLLSFFCYFSWRVWKAVVSSRVSLGIIYLSHFPAGELSDTYLSSRKLFSSSNFAFVLQIYRFEFSTLSTSTEAAATESLCSAVVGGQEAGTDMRGEREGWGVGNEVAQ